MQIRFRQTKVTQGALVFTELMDNGELCPNPSKGKIGTIYIRKDSELGQTNPSKIIVNVERSD